MDAEEFRAPTDQIAIADATAAFEEQRSAPSDVQGSTSTELPPSPPRPWGFCATWLWLIPLSGGLVVAQSVAIFAYVVVLSILTHAAGETLNAGNLADEIRTNGLVLSLCTLATTTMVPILLMPIIWLRGLPFAQYLGLVRPSRRQLALSALLVAALVACTDLSAWALGKPIVPEFMLQVHSTAGFIPLLWLTMIVLAPLGEELVFRGFLLAPRSSRLVMCAGLVLTSSAWAAIHMQYELFGILSIFGAGLVLGMVRLRTGLTTLTIWMHALINAISTAELYAYLYFFE